MILDSSYDTLAKKTGLSESTIKHILSIAIEEAVKEIFNARFAHTDFEKRQVTVIQYCDEDIPFEEAAVFDSNIVPTDPISMTYDFESFPDSFLKKINGLFDILLTETTNSENFMYWKNKKIIEGVINDKHHDHLTVSLLNDMTAILEKRHFVPKEAPYYQIGKLMYFYVNNVTRVPFKIYLSRASIQLPALLLKIYMPLYRFDCKKRYIGHKSVIHTDAPIDGNLREIRNRVSQELHGEILEIRSIQTGF